MYPLQSRWTTIAVLATMGVLCLGIRSDAVPAASSGLSAQMKLLPSRTLWAWERPEDLHAINPQTTAIAYLDQTIVLGRDVVSQRRRQSLVYPSSAKLIAVVRIEAAPNAELGAAQEQQVVGFLLDSARRPGIAALQVDFDATRSQRTFYRDLLTDLRRQMPASLPLSITALASWCSNDDWIADLPIDEAVPMLFRMEPDRRYAAFDLPQFRIREPKCMGSVGISTHEARPDDMAGKRIYVFADRGWREDFPLIAARKLP
jgi:hypothetical protein